MCMHQEPGPLGLILVASSCWGKLHGNIKGSIHSIGDLIHIIFPMSPHCGPSKTLAQSPIWITSWCGSGSWEYLSGCCMISAILWEGMDECKRRGSAWIYSRSVAHTWKKVHSRHTSVISPCLWIDNVTLLPDWSTTQPPVPLSKPVKTLTQSPCLYMHCKWRIRELYWAGSFPSLLIAMTADLFCRLTNKIHPDVLWSSPSVRQMRSSCHQNCPKNILIVQWIRGGSIPASEWRRRSSRWGTLTTSSTFFKKDHWSRPLW